MKKKVIVSVLAIIVLALIATGIGINLIKAIHFKELTSTIIIIDTSKDEIPKNYVKTWTYNEIESENPVKAWLVKNDENRGMYDLYLGAEDGIKLTNANSLFREFFYCKEIKGLEKMDTSNVTDMYCMFSSCDALTNLDLSNFDTSNVTDMYGMFYCCDKLTNIDLSNFDTSNVTNMSGIFWNCKNLANIDLINFNTSNVTDMSSMFSSCEALTNLDLSNFDTSNVTNMNGMFYCCNNLKTLNLSNFDVSNVTDMSFMFYGCDKLTNIDKTQFNSTAF